MKWLLFEILLACPIHFSVYTQYIFKLYMLKHHHYISSESKSISSFTYFSDVVSHHLHASFDVHDQWNSKQHFSTANSTLTLNSEEVNQPSLCIKRTNIYIQNFSLLWFFVLYLFRHIYCLYAHVEEVRLSSIMD